MPVAGANDGSRMEIGRLRTPENYIPNPRRKYAPGSRTTVRLITEEGIIF
jgi:hypothetical protein